MAEEKLKSWRYGPGGEVKLFDSDEELPEGWYDHPSLVPDGSAESLAEIGELRAAYRKRFKKNPGPRWDEATLREKLG
jgi:hypothetical protein